MADFNKSIGRGRRLQFAAQQIKNKKTNNLQNQLYLAGSYQYTNESIENFCNKLADKYNNECSGYSANHQSQIERTPPGQSLTSTQFQDDDESDVLDIVNKTSSLDMSSRQSPSGLHGAESSDSPGEHHKFDGKDDVTGSSIPYNPFLANFEKTTPIQNNQIRNPPFKVMGRGQVLKTVAATIPKHKKTLQDEIQAFGSEYSNQSIEKFVERLSGENGDKN